jgi:hypothetical protein
MIAFSNEACFVTCNRTIGVAFDFINPLAPDYIVMGRRRNKTPCLLPLKSLIFIQHGSFLFRVFGGNRVRSRFNIKGVDYFGMKKKFVFGYS